MDNQFSTYVRQFCRQNHISLEKLAEQAGIARGTLYHLLDQDTQPKVVHLLQLAQAMNVHHNVLFRLKWSEFGILHTPTIKDDETYITKVEMDMCGFVDETVPDGSIVTAGCQFDKSWTLQNMGDVVWQNRYLLCLDEPLSTPHYPNGHCVDDYRLKASSNIIEIPTTQPMDKVTLTVTLTAPNVAGRYISYWKMIDEYGKLCFPNAIGVSAQVLVLSTDVCRQVTPPDNLADFIFG